MEMKHKRVVWTCHGKNTSETKQADQFLDETHCEKQESRCDDSKSANRQIERLLMRFQETNLSHDGLKDMTMLTCFSKS